MQKKVFCREGRETVGCFINEVSKEEPKPLQFANLQKEEKNAES